jgi:hypothetical protein
MKIGLIPVNVGADMGVIRLIVPLPALGKGSPAENLKSFSENVISKIG